MNGIYEAFEEIINRLKIHESKLKIEDEVDIHIERRFNGQIIY